MFSLWQKWVGLTVACALLSGCGGGGPTLTSAKGRVTYNGKPVAGASVTFMPTEQGAQVASGVTDAEGQFSLNTLGRPGAAQGQYQVGVVKATSQGDTSSLTPDDMKKMVDAKKKPQSKSEIPVKYAGPQTSGLKATVTAEASKNQFDFSLTD